jgi:hypothetical protein
MAVIVLRLSGRITSEVDSNAIQLLRSGNLRGGVEGNIGTLQAVSNRITFGCDVMTDLEEVSITTCEDDL